MKLLIKQTLFWHVQNGVFLFYITAWALTVWGNGGKNGKIKTRTRYSILC